MSTEIYAFLEAVNSVDNSVRFISKIKLDQWYDMFAFMANVRNLPERGLKEPVALPKGLPENITPEVAKEVEFWEMDGWAHSWLRLEELEEVQRRLSVAVDEADGATLGPDESLADLILKMYLIRETGCEPRLVFWFA